MKQRLPCSAWRMKTRRSERKRPRWRPVCLRRTPPRSAAEKIALVFEPHLSPDSLRRLCTALMEQCTGVCAAFSGTDAGGYKYALGSAGGADVHALCKEMNAALGGRGGGREMQQGSAACTRGDIEAFFAPRWGNTAAGEGMGNKTAAPWNLSTARPFFSSPEKRCRLSLPECRPEGRPP
mgnify:CR=1 FL=1